MNYQEALTFIHSVNNAFCIPGLERIKILCERMGNPQDKLKFIHVAGTNGKGSFCSMLSSVLQNAGYTVGTYTSPYILKFNERMSVNGQMITDQELSLLATEISDFVKDMADKPTEFETITAIAFKYFLNHNCDYVVLECGLGGRFDATNIITTPILSVITGIAIDHTSFLGNTIEQIASEKAGIIKSGVPCLWCGEDESAYKVINDNAKEVGSTLYTVDHTKTTILSADLNGTVFNFGEYDNVRIPLLGTYQPFNATNVLSATDILKTIGVNIPETAIREGLANTVWHARFEIICKKPLIIADGGHNPEGIKSAVESIKLYFPHQKVNIVTGVMKDKDYRYIAKEISSVANTVFCITPDNPRALPAEEYAETFKEVGAAALHFETLEQAVVTAIEQTKEENIPLICLGSLYMYKETVEAVNNYIKEN